MSTREPAPTRESITAARADFARRYDALTAASPGTAWGREALLLAEDAMSEALAARNGRMLDSAQAVECRRALEAIAADAKADAALKQAATAAIQRAREAL
ncbi:hypothetical protein [Microcystis phage Mae-JY09]